MVGEDADVHQHHEDHRHRGAKADVLRKQRRSALAREHVHADAEEDGVDHQHEQERGWVEHQITFGEVQRQLVERMREEDTDRRSPEQEREGDEQFEIDDNRSVDEVFNSIKKAGLQPVLTDGSYV